MGTMADQLEEDRAWASLPGIARALYDATAVLSRQGGDTPFDGVIGRLWTMLLEYHGTPVNTPAVAELSISLPNESSVRRRSMTNRIRLQVFRRDGFCCRACGTSEDLQVDHIYPWSRGGDNSLDNLQTLCAHCNQMKGAS